MIKTFIAAAKLHLKPTLEYRLQYAFDANNVCRFIDLVEKNAGAGIHDVVNTILRDGIENGKVDIFVRIYGALAGKACDWLIRPLRVCEAVYKVHPLHNEILMPKEQEERMRMLADLGTAAEHFDNPVHANLYQSTVRGLVGRNMPVRENPLPNPQKLVFRLAA